MTRALAFLTGSLLLGPSTPLLAEQLYTGDSWPAVTSDRKASAVGDAITVVILESTQAASRLQNNSSRKSQFGGALQAGGFNESANLNFGGSYAGNGEIVRSEKFVAQISATIIRRLSNGDLVVEGQQHLLINGEKALIGVCGRIRPQDITADNTVPSSRIADAQIDYDGKGFVSRSAKPGLINRILGFLGIG